MSSNEKYQVYENSPTRRNSPLNRMGTSEMLADVTKATIPSSISNNHQEVLQETMRNLVKSVASMILPHKQQLSIQGTLGVTVDCDHILLVHITETVLKKDHEEQETRIPPDLQMPTISQVYSLDNKTDSARGSVASSGHSVPPLGHPTTPTPVVIQPVGDLGDAHSTHHNTTHRNTFNEAHSTKTTSSCKRKGACETKEGQRKKVTSAEHCIRQVKREKFVQASAPSLHQQIGTVQLQAPVRQAVGLLSGAHFDKKIKAPDQKPMPRGDNEAGCLVSCGSAILQSALSKDRFRLKPYHLRVKRRPRDPSGALTSYSSMDLGLPAAAKPTPPPPKKSSPSTNLLPKPTVNKVLGKLASSQSEVSEGVSGEGKAKSKGGEGSASLLGMLLTADLSIAQMQQAGIQGTLAGGLQREAGPSHQDSNGEDKEVYAGEDSNPSLHVAIPGELVSLSQKQADRPDPSAD